MTGKSGVKSPEDVFTREVIVAGSGAGSSLSIVPAALNNLLGTKFKVVEGYQGSADAMLALERGEVDGICHTHGVFQSHHAQMVKDGALKILFHVEEADFHEDPSIPSIYKFAKTDKQKQMLRFLFSSTEFGRPYVTPPGVPAERVAALRKAFADALKDPALIEEAKTVIRRHDLPAAGRTGKAGGRALRHAERNHPGTGKDRARVRLAVTGRGLFRIVNKRKSEWPSDRTITPEKTTCRCAPQCRRPPRIRTS